ncbi:MAG: peptide chain release factor N(5)-glutamine methyltransferase [Ancrocorticia sp.]
MGWNELVAAATATFRAAGLDSPEADARELAEVAGGERLHVLLATGAPTPEQRARFDSMVAARATRVPLQHVTGVMYFRYLELASRPGCFIVRPETELVAEEAITALRAAVARILDDDGVTSRAFATPPVSARPNERESLRPGASQSPASACPAERASSRPGAQPDSARPLAVDLCTGSGAIALALATEVPEARVSAVELSDSAIEVARENNARYGAVVDLVHGDARTELENLVGQVDVVVTNPPYVPPTHQVSVEALSDPALALWGGGVDGTDLPRELIARAAELLRPGGILVMEHAEEQAQTLVNAALTSGFARARTGYDYTGRPRWLWAQLGNDCAESKGHQ